MLARLSLIFLAVTFTVSQHSISINQVIPNYIKKALRQKNEFKTLPREKTRTFTNQTLNEVLAKIKDITRTLNADAQRNGYKVDYKLRMLNMDLKIK